MPRRSLLTAPLLAMALAHGAVVKTETLPAFREGLNALSAHLWDIAGIRFESLLQTPDLDPAGRKLILFHLIEARIRAADFASADKLLADPVLKDDPELPFWKAQALTGMGKLREALALLDDKALAPDGPHYTETVFTRAALQQSLGDSKDALETLAPLLKDKSPSNVERARIRSAVILLSLNRAADALAMLPPDASVKGSRAAQTSLLRAQALLATGDTKAATTIFTQLLASEDPAYRLQKQDAAIGLAQAQLASGQRSNAVDGLLAYLRQHEDSPRIGPVFEQLYLCLPESDLSPNDAILSRLEGWMPPPLPRPPQGFIADEVLATGGHPPDEALSALWPTAPPATSEFNIQALYYRALGLRREGSETLRTEARQLLNRLLVEYGSHPLALRALWELAQWNLEDATRRQDAALVLEGIERLAARNPGETSLAQAAQLTAAHRQFLAGDFKQAGTILKEASRSLTGAARQAVSVDAGSALLANGDLAGFDAFAHGENAEPISADLSLERALFLASRRDPAALKSLDQFILSNPNHPRLAEARLASAHAALESGTPDLMLAKAQLESIPVAAEVPAGSLALAQVRLAAQSGDWAQAINLAQGFLDKHPNDPRQEEITFELGNARFQNREFVKAQLVFQNLVAAYPDSALTQPALLLAARAAALGTTQSREQSIALFDKAIFGKGPLADLARLEKADTQIELNKLNDAITTLDPWLKGMKKDDPLRLSAGLLLGQALYTSGNLDRALEVYNGLLADLPADSPQRFQLKYRTGLALEKKGEAGKALEAYYSVLDLTKAQQGQVSDWQWVDKCGIGARRLLEEGHRWEAAIKVAEKHAALPSPGAKEAGERAGTLKLEHMVMDDDDSSSGR